jgi:hypothetical protein
MPTHTCFGTKMSSSVSLITTNDRKVQRGRNNIKFTDDQQAKAICNYKNTMENLCRTHTAYVSKLLLLDSLMMALWFRNMQVLAHNMKYILRFVFHCILDSAFCWLIY